MSWFRDQFGLTEEDANEYEEERKSLLERISVQKSELEALRLFNKQASSELEEKCKAEIETLDKAISAVKSHKEQLTDESEYLKQEISLLQEKLSKAEEVNRDLAKSIQDPKDRSELAEEDGTEEFYRKELVISRQTEANLKGVITAKKLLIEDAKREKEDLQGLLKLKDQQIAAVFTDSQLQVRAQELQSLRDTLTTLKSERKSRTQISNKSELTDQIRSSQRSIESLLSEKAALVVQLETIRGHANSSQLSTQQTSRIASLGVFRQHRSLRKAANVLDQLVSGLWKLMDTQSIVRLGLVLYMLVLHFLVLFSALGNRQGCPGHFMG